jgi:hypothetical protein
MILANLKTLRPWSLIKDENHSTSTSTTQERASRKQWQEQSREQAYQWIKIDSLRMRIT